VTGPDESPVCRRCGAGRERDDLAWAFERDADGTQRWLCPQCARHHVRDVEAKLPHEWW
jgi:transposase-like protein